AYARDWAASYLDACQATQVRGEQSPDLLDRRMACLEHSRVSLAATVGVLTSADRSTAEKAAAAVATLPALEACSDREALLSATPVPSDAVTRARINAASAQLATSEALLSGGKPKPALDAALALV